MVDKFQKSKKHEEIKNPQQEQQYNKKAAPTKKPEEEKTQFHKKTGEIGKDKGHGKHGCC